MDSLPSVLPIVLGYSRFATTTGLCLETLLPQAASLDTSVLAIDNGSPDNSASLLELYKTTLPSSLQDYLQTRIHAGNLGYGGGMNEAVKYGLETNSFHQNGKPPEWLLLVNSDTLFPANSLKAWLSALALVPPTVGIVAPLTNNAGNAQKITLKSHSALTQTNHLLNEIERIKLEFETWSLAAKDWIDRPTGLIWPIPRADFFCIAIRTSIWQQLNGLDPIYGRGYYEDFDFSLRAIAAGYQCVLTEDCLIYHQGSASFKASSEQKQLIRRNHQIFKNRFPHAHAPHVRQSNLELLIGQLSWLDGQATDSNAASHLLMRMMTRWLATQSDRPRSMFKRWMWMHRLIKIQKHYPQYLPKPD